MILFHGSNVEVKVPQIIKSKRLLDFGTGFYLTSDFEQAKKWAVRTTNRREAGVPIISVFEIDDSQLERLDTLIFEQAIRTVNNYLKGYFTEEIAIQLLLPQKLKDQYAFKTEEALAILGFKEVRFV